MNTNQIRKFATEARILLLKGVSNSLRTFFSDSGEPIIVPKPVQGGCAFGAQTKDEAFLRRWQSLQHQITLHGFRWVVEQVAYTWFNRLVAINILAKNNLAEPMLQFANPALRVPYIVEQARAGHFPEMSAADIATLRELLNDDAKTFEQFSLLIGCYCTANPIIRRCFGCVDDHSLLLLPSNILSEGEIVDMLNRSDLITDDEYRSPELIGWLYQFYISERKDEVFAKKGKFEADEIPAATQIFTPNWIVKYLVQNSLGRIYLDNEPYSELKSSMQYLVPAEPSSEKFTFVDVKDLTCADLACGSGHILNECFDLLYDIYIEQGYSRRDAVENIFAHNLIGIDIDTRAKQLATFALLLKACRRDATFADAHAMPRVLDMPEPYRSDIDLRDTLHHFFLGGTPKQIDETAKAIALFDHA
ncbi:MAG: SAM-dependent methyltransferase, partial [Muribaculaceae bacterium]